MATYTGAATWYDCTSPGCGCNTNCVCTNCSEKNGGTECCTACCEACDSAATAGGAYINLSGHGTCNSSYPSLSCNTSVTVKWPCGGTIDVTIYDHDSYCGSLSTKQNCQDASRAAILDLMSGTFIGTGASLGGGPITVTMTT